jgi:GxxExxY protein
VFIRGKETKESPMTDDELNAITEKIIGCAFRVSNALGCGFLEKVYENALIHEMRKCGLNVRQQEQVNVFYDGIVVGEFWIDLLVEDQVILELKAAKEHHDVFTAQCLNYLRATGKPLCLLLNFGKPRLEIKRFRRGLDWPQKNADEHR